MRLNPKQIARSTGGTFLVEPIDGSEILTGITWDSRDVKPGDLYVALPGEHVDGHEFVEAAIRAGARGALVTDAPSKTACVLARELGVPVIEVPNTMHAVWDLACTWRDHINAKVIAITGSVGKTTTKTLVRDVCASKHKTVATIANQNNELGVPNTILAANLDTEVIVVEMGMRGLGQIRELCEIARPDWGLVTNVGESHMELLGSKENIARAKSELFAALPEGSGIAFANATDDCTQQLLEMTHVHERNVDVVMFGAESGDVCVWAKDVVINADGRPQFTLCARGFIREETGEPTLFNMEPDVQTASCHLSMCGEHNVMNACSAAAVGLALGIDIADVVSALEGALSETGRLETLKARDGFIVINDTYNANPDSMRAALGMLVSMDVAGRRIAVLGDMGELGDGEVACHKSVGEACATSNLDELICIGELSKHIAQGAREAGLADENIRQVGSIGEALEALEGALGSSDVVLVKASHFMNLDRLVEGLVA